MRAKLISSRRGSILYSAVTERASVIATQTAPLDGVVRISVHVQITDELTPRHAKDTYLSADSAAKRHQEFRNRVAQAIRRARAGSRR